MSFARFVIVHTHTHTLLPNLSKMDLFSECRPVRSAPRKYWQNIFVQYYCSRSFYLKCTQTKGKKIKLLYLLRFDKCDPMTINSCSWGNTNEFFFLKLVFPSKHNWDVTVKLFYNKCTLFLSNLTFDHFRLSTKIILLEKTNPFNFKISQKKLFVDTSSVSVPQSNLLVEKLFFQKKRKKKELIIKI
jgi:hypothetical protein